MFSILFKNRRLLWELAKNDCKARFSSSLLGVFWTILQPLINMLVIWFVFQAGFKSANISGDIVFIVWYMPAFLIWNYFSESTSQGTGSIIEYSYLVKKVNFDIEIIPAIKIVSNLLIHSFFIIFIMAVNICYGIFPNMYYIQAIYYLICAVCLAHSLSVLFSSLAPFATDITNLVAIAIQIGFWATPIFWDATQMNSTVRMILKINPMYYICQGYRESFVYGVGFWEHPVLTCYFWILCICIYWIAIRTFKNSKRQFDDVL